MEDNEFKYYSKIEIPGDFLTRLMFHEYRPQDLRSALVAIYAVRYSVILSFIFSNAIFFFLYDFFFIFNFIISLILSIVSVTFSFYKFGLDKKIYLENLSIKFLIKDFIALLLSFFIISFGIYIVIFQKMELTPPHVYLVYVILNAVFFTGIVSFSLSHLAVQFLRICERIKR